MPKDLWEWLRDIREETRSIMGSIGKEELTWYPNGNLKAIKYYDKDNNLLLTLTFTWDNSGNLVKIERS